MLSSLSARPQQINKTLLQTTPQSSSKIASKIADSLNKFRQAANDDITLTQSSADDLNKCDDDELDDENHLIDAKTMMANQINNSGKKSSEIWLEYGCI